MSRDCAKYTADPVMLGQRCRQLTGNEPATGCDAGPTLNGIWWVSLHPLYGVHRRQILNECWPEPAMVVEGIHFNLSPCLFPQLYPGFWRMKKANTLLCLENIRLLSCP